MTKYMKRLIFIGMMIIATLSSFAQVTISMENKGGVFYIPGKVNGLPLQFIFDTGASNVYISLTEALFMLKNDYISETDFGGSSYAQVADGSIVENTEITLREIEVAGIKLYNIKAYVSNSLNAPLLFGQSAIQKLGPIQIDGNKLIISNGKNLPSNETAFSLYQKAYQESEAGNYDNAIKLSEQAIAMSTDKQLRAILYDNIAYAYYHSGRKEKAIDALNAAIGEDLMCEQPAYNLGVYHFEMGQYAQALRALNIFVERHKNTKDKDLLAAAYAYKGDCHNKNGQVVEAESAYKNSLALSSNTQSMLGLADLYLNNQRYSEAIPLYQTALKYEPNRLSNIKRHHQLALCFSRLNHNSDALSAYRDCISAIAANRDLIGFALKSDDESLQNDASYYIYLGYTAQLWIARLTTEPSETITNYEQVVNIPGLTDEMTFQDFNHWASAYLVNGNTPRALSKALEILKKGLEVFPNNPELLYSCSHCTEEASTEHLDYLVRILDYEYKYKPIFFDFGTIYNNIAWHYTLNKNYKEGLSYAQTAVRLNPEHIYSWDTLGEIYYNLGKYEECIEAFSHCLKSEEPEQIKKAHTYRGNSYIHLGKKKDGNRELDLAK